MRLVLILIFPLTFCREIYYDDFKYSPTESDFINYGSLKVTRSRNRTVFFLRGNFSIYREIGLDKRVTLELWKEKGLLLRSVNPFCNFIKNDNLFWPELLKNSNMPPVNTCPFPTVRIIFYIQFIIF